MSGQIRIGYPNAGSYSVSTNADNTRTNLQNLREMFAQGAGAPGFDIPVSGGMTYTGGLLTGVLLQEQTAAAAADTPTRTSAQRIFVRQTLTYTSGSLTKVRYEISYDSGTTYANWTDLAGNSYQNLTYSAGALASVIWGTS
jgi:hypothetical protein